MKLFLQISFVVVSLLYPYVSRSQGNHEVPVPVTGTAAPVIDTVSPKKVNTQAEDAYDQKDLIDLGRKLLKKKTIRHIDTNAAKTTNVRYSGIPAAGYTLQTGFAALLNANAAFYLDTDKKENESIVVTSLTYSQYRQIIFPLQVNIWTKDNKYNFVTDWRYLKYPSITYGLGGFSALSDGYNIDYSALRLHQTLYKRMTSNLYLGLGYNFDYFWNISETDPPTGKTTDFESYDAQGKSVKKTEIASGITLNFLHDSRGNPINPLGGDFINVIYRPNFTFMGNVTNWQSLIFDLRKYIKIPETNNILAFWTYDWLTISGNPPYLLLPNTGGDPNSNSGRGYIQGRFRGKDMLYVEGEYRFAITHNGLLGGVVFANAESFSQSNNMNNFGVIAPGYGAGIRIKLNKFSGTNVCLDYGFGANGSGGFFVNLGEVF